MEEHIIIFDMILELGKRSTEGVKQTEGNIEGV